jgi:uncharacterized metal-binding protein YceD (DUF177 family)
MKVHLNQIPDHGLHIEGNDPASILELKDPLVRPVSDVGYDLEIGVSDGGLFATGRVGVELEMECVSCLEKFERRLELPDFACQIELTGSETVDLTEPIREDILLALPPHPHCDWNGEKVCKGAARVAQIHAAASDPLPEEKEVWGALDQLKIKKT